MVIQLLHMSFCITITMLGAVGGAVVAQVCMEPSSCGLNGIKEWCVTVACLRRDMLEGYGSDAQGLGAPSFPFNCSIVLDGSPVAASVDMNQEVFTGFPVPEAGSEQVPERYAIMIILM